MIYYCDCCFPILSESIISKLFKIPNELCLLLPLGHPEKWQNRSYQEIHIFSGKILNMGL